MQCHFLQEKLLAVCKCALDSLCLQCSEICHGGLFPLPESEPANTSVEPKAFLGNPAIAKGQVVQVNLQHDIPLRPSTLAVHSSNAQKRALV